jgi:predicted RNase H-like nuclease (RuvC/YqgF family)
MTPFEQWQYDTRIMGLEAAVDRERKEYAKLVSESIRLSDENQELRKSFDHMDTEIERLRTDLANRDAARNLTVEANDETIAELRREVVRLTAELIEKEATIKGHEATIRWYRDEAATWSRIAQTGNRD